MFDQTSLELISIYMVGDGFPRSGNGKITEKFVFGNSSKLDVTR